MNLHSLSRKNIALLLGIDPSSVSRWYSQGMPRNVDRTYNGPRCVQWFVSRLEERATKAAEDAPNESAEAQRWLAEFRKERAKLARLERKKCEGGLISKQDVARQWIARAREFITGLTLLESLLPLILEGKSRAEMKRVIHEEVIRMRLDIVREGRFCPSPLLKKKSAKREKTPAEKKASTERKEPAAVKK